MLFYIIDLIRGFHFGRFSASTALVDGVSGKSYSLAEVRDLSRRLASGLLRLGTEPGQVIIIITIITIIILMIIIRWWPQSSPMCLSILSSSWRPPRLA